MNVKSIIKYCLYIFLAIILLIFGVLVHAGLFVKVEISEKIMGPYSTVYWPHKGGYQKIGGVIEDIQLILSQNDIEASDPSFGHYLDNPFDGTTKIRDLRSHAGIIINLEVADLILSAGIEDSFEMKTIPQDTYIVVELPFRSEFSKITGPLKVYPAIAKYLKKSNARMQSLVEIFDNQNSRLLYLSPVPKG